MRAFRTLWIDSMKMLLRNRVLIVTSLGIGLISIFVFGWLFGGNGNFTLHLGVVNEDGSATSAQMVQQLKQNTSLNVSTGSDAGEMAALRAGNRDADVCERRVLGTSGRVHCETFGRATATGT